ALPLHGWPVFPSDGAERRHLSVRSPCRAIPAEECPPRRRGDRLAPCPASFLLRLLQHVAQREPGDLRPAASCAREFLAGLSVASPDSGSGRAPVHRCLDGHPRTIRPMTATLSAAARLLAAHWRGTPTLLSANLYLTNRCNLRCLYCSSP